MPWPPPTTKDYPHISCRCKVC